MYRANDTLSQVRFVIFVERVEIFLWRASKTVRVLFIYLIKFISSYPGAVISVIHVYLGST